MAKFKRKGAKEGENEIKVKGKKLTAKQESFCQSYLIDFNATRAARDAGYSAPSASEIGNALLRNVKIQQRIHILREEMGKNFNITRERIAQELAKLSFFNLKDLYDEEGNLLPIPQLPDNVAAAISGVEVANLWERDLDNRPMIVGETKKVKTADKKGALELLTRLMGYAAPEKAPVDETGKAVIPIINMNIIQPPKEDEEGL